MDGMDDLDGLAEEIAAGATKKPEAKATGLTEGAPSADANEDPAEMTATKEVFDAIQSGDLGALNAALKSHYTICNGSPEKKPL